MQKTKLLISIIFISTHLLSQSKQDYIWFFGSDQDTLEGIQGLRFDFNLPSFNPNVENNGLEFDRNNASVCDENGNLLFYTNGCAVSNSLHQIMTNGDSINSGTFFDTFWLGDCSLGYPGRQDIIILQDPAYSDGYFIIHKTRELFQENDFKTYMKFLKYTYVDMQLENGLGAVVEKNVPFFESRFLWSYLTAIKHKNKKDWWIIQPKDSEETKFYTLLLSDSGFEVIDSSILLEKPFDENSSASGDAKFSPDGTKYAFFNLSDNLNVFDFDRKTGILSNYRYLEFSDPSNSKFASVEFSPNSRFVYLSNTDSLFQVDLWEDNLEDGKILIDTYDGVLDPFPTTFFISTLGPDCRIYIRPGSGSYIMHVINKPNEKGLDCDFVERGLRFLQPTSTGSFPNFPRYRVDEEDKCDPTITSLFGEAVYYRRDLEAYPNPVVDLINIDIPDQQIGELFLIDLKGQMIWNQKILGTSTKQHDFSFLESGMYNLEFIPDNNPNRLIWTKQIVKIR